MRYPAGRYRQPSPWLERDAELAQTFDDGRALAGIARHGGAGLRQRAVAICLCGLPGLLIDDQGFGARNRRRKIGALLARLLLVDAELAEFRVDQAVAISGELPGLQKLQLTTEVGELLLSQRVIGLVAGLQRAAGRVREGLARKGR